MSGTNYIIMQERAVGNRNTMDALLLEQIVATVKDRIAEGNSPMTSYPAREDLVAAVVELARERDYMKRILQAIDGDPSRAQLLAKSALGEVDGVSYAFAPLEVGGDVADLLLGLDGRADQHVDG